MWPSPDAPKVIIGTYPNLFREGRPGELLTDTLNAVRNQVPPARGLWLHILPFFPHCGDDGYSVVDHSAVDSRLGDWSDVAKFAEHYPLISDGVFAYVGVEHPLFQAALRGDAAAHEAFYLRGDPPVSDDIGEHRRIGFPFQERVIQDSKVWVLQTFGGTSVDINLRHAKVVEYVDSALAKLRDAGIQGLRLDAVAFLAKDIDGGSLHGPEAPVLVSELCRRARELGFRFVLGQADIDSVGQRYLLEGAGVDALVDYAFSALLCEAVISSNVAPLVRHLDSTSALRFAQIHACRSHDGIYLGSPNIVTAGLDADVLSRSAHIIGDHGTIVNGSLYELNGSFPRYCRGTGSANEMWALLELSVALTMLTHGIAYFYLPMLFGHEPEAIAPIEGRGCNRIRLSKSQVQSQAIEIRTARLVNVITALLKVETESGYAASMETAYHLPSQGAVQIERPAFGLTGIFNFSRTSTLDHGLRAGNVILAHRCTQDRIGPMGYAVVARESSRWGSTLG